MGLTRHHFVAEITVVVDAAGTTQTFLYGTSGFATGPSDTPAHTVVEPRLEDPGSVVRELFSGARVAGGVRPSFGRLVLFNGDGALDDWIEYGTSNGLVTLRWGPEGAAYPAAWTTVYVARIVGSPQADDRTLQLALQDRAHLLDAPMVVSTFTGAGGREGEGVAGLRKPLLLGEPGYTPVQVLDAARGIVYVQANAADARVHGGGAPVYHLFDAGVRLTHAGTVASWAAFTAAAPDAGTFTTYVGDADTGATTGPTTGPVFMRYGSAPNGELRARAAGYLLNHSADTLRQWRYSDLLARAGITDALASGSSDFALGSRWIDDDTTFAAVANDCGRALQLAWGFDRLDRPFALALKDPADTTAAADTVRFVFDKHNARGIVRLPVPGMEAPVWQVVCNAGETWPCAVGPTADAEVRAQMSRQWPYVSFSATAAAVRTAHPGAMADTVTLQGRYFTTRPEQRAFGERYLSLYGGRRDLFRLTCLQFDATTLALELHDKVQLLHARWGCTPARTLRIIGIVHDLRRRESTFTLWGGDPGPGLDGSGASDGTVTVGDGPLTPGSSPGGSGTSTPPQQESSDGGTTAEAVTPTLPPCTHYFAVTAANSGGGASSGVTLDGTQTLAACGHVFEAVGDGTDAEYANRVLLLHFDGSDGSTTITDSSSYAHSCTAAGAAAISTDVPEMFGGAALQIVSGGDCVDVPDHAAFDFGTGEVVWDFWLSLTNAGGGALISKASTTSGLAHEWALFIGAEYATLYYGTRGSSQFNLRLFWPSAWPLNTRVRGSVQRNAAGEWACHLNGQRGTRYQVAPLASSLVFGAVTTGTYTDAFDVGSTTNAVKVGNFAAVDVPLPGYLDELRMSVGAGAWGESYTPELEPFANS